DIFGNFYVQQIAIIRRREWMKDRMICINELERLGIAFTGVNAAFGFKTHFAQTAGDGWCHTVHDQDNAATAREVARQKPSRIRGLEITALDAKNVRILVCLKFASQLCWFQNASCPLT